MGPKRIVKKLGWPNFRKAKIEEVKLPKCVLIKFYDETLRNRTEGENGYVAITAD